MAYMMDAGESDTRPWPSEPLRAGQDDRKKDAVDEAMPSQRYAAGVVAVLMLVTLNSLLDRYLPPLLTTPMKRSLKLSDSEMSLVQGLAFAVSYVVLSLPMGALVDRSNRRNLIVIGMLIWSGTTILCGFATGVWTLFVARTGVGVGEACLLPAACAMISDYVKPEYRGRALGLYFMSLAIGSGSSLLLGASILHLLPSDDLVSLGFLGQFAPWQVVFLLAGASGLAILPLMATVREPARRTLLGARVASDTPKRKMRDFLGFLNEHRKLFACVYTSYSLVGFSSICMVSWAPAYLGRQFGMPLVQIGTGLGTAMIFGALLGGPIGGLLSDRHTKKAMKGTRMRAVLVAASIQVPSIVAWCLVDAGPLCFALFALVMLANTIGLGTSSAALQEVVPPDMRGQAVALSTLISGILGLGLGPTAVALVTDYGFGDDAMLGYSMTIVAGGASLLAGVFGVAAYPAYDRLRARRQSGEAA